MANVGENRGAVLQSKERGGKTEGLTEIFEATALHYCSDCSCSKGPLGSRDLVP